MIYREVGQFKASYAADQAIFPIRQDRWLLLAALAFAYLVIPAVTSEYWLLTIMVPFLVYALAALGLNLLTGYAGQVSLGTGGFTSVPGAIVGGLIVGVGEKVAEVFWGPAFGGAIEDWFAYALALVFLLFRPQGLFGERIIERV